MRHAPALCARVNSHCIRQRSTTCARALHESSRELSVSVSTARYSGVVICGRSGTVAPAPIRTAIAAKN